MAMQLYQLVDDLVRSKIGTRAREALDVWATLLNDKLDLPLDISLSSNVLTIEAGIKQKLETDGVSGTQNAIQWRIPTLGGLDILPVQSTLNVDTGASTGDFDNNPATGKSITANYYVQMGIELRQDGKFYAVWGDAAATFGATTVPPFSKSKAFPILVAKLQKNGSTGTWGFLTPTKSNIALIKGGAGGGGGAGDTTGLLESMKNAALDLPYELLTPCVFDTDELTLTDAVSSTGSFSYSDRAYGFSVSGQQFMSANVLDQVEFIDDGLKVGRMGLIVNWKPGKVDANASYWASRNGVTGTFYPITMDRAGNGTDTFYGELIFDAAAPADTSDLRIKVLAGTGTTALDAFGVFYRNIDAGMMITGRNNTETQVFNSFSDKTGAGNCTFMLTRFIPDPDFIIAICDGSVYHSGDFLIDGYKITFADNFFQEAGPGRTMKIKFMHVGAGSFDNADVNASLLAGQHLGSTDPNFDRSGAGGRGIMLRRPDGTLREVALDDSDNITILDT